MSLSVSVPSACSLKATPAVSCVGLYCKNNDRIFQSLTTLYLREVMGSTLRLKAWREGVHSVSGWQWAGSLYTVVQQWQVVRVTRNFFSCIYGIGGREKEQSGNIGSMVASDRDISLGNIITILLHFVDKHFSRIFNACEGPRVHFVTSGINLLWLAEAFSRLGWGGGGG